MLFCSKCSPRVGPYIPWGDAPQAPGAPLTGYCTHSKSETLLTLGMPAECSTKVKQTLSFFYHGTAHI